MNQYASQLKPQPQAGPSSDGPRTETKRESPKTPESEHLLVRPSLISKRQMVTAHPNRLGINSGTSQIVVRIEPRKPLYPSKGPSQNDVHLLKLVGLLVRQI